MRIVFEIENNHKPQTVRVSVSEYYIYMCASVCATRMYSLKHIIIGSSFVDCNLRGRAKQELGQKHTRVACSIDTFAKRLTHYPPSQRFASLETIHLI